MVKRFIAVLLLSLKSVYADEVKLSPEQVLLNTMQAMSHLNYQGTIAFFRNGKLETMKYFHAVANGIEQERLVSLNSPAREIVRDAEQVTCLFKSTQQTIVDHRPFERSFLIDLPKNLSDLNPAYEFTMQSEEDIAMLPAYVIAIQPKDSYRYIRKIWVDKKQFLPLKAEVRDSNGTTLEQFVFTDLQVKNALPFVDVKTEKSQHIHQIQTQSSQQAAFVLSELPPGFKEIFFARMPVPNSDQAVDHLLLSDGITSISVYLDSRKSQLQPGLQAVGAVNSFSRAIENSELTVMGEVPAKTVEMIAQGVKLRQ